jgi:hypothetical protein
MPLPVRPRVAATTNWGKAPGLSEVQKRELGSAEAVGKENRKIAR